MTVIELIEKLKELLPHKADYVVTHMSGDSYDLDLNTVNWIDEEPKCKLIKHDIGLKYIAFHGESIY